MISAFDIDHGSDISKALPKTRLATPVTPFAAKRPKTKLVARKVKNETYLAASKAARVLHSNSPFITPNNNFKVL